MALESVKIRETLKPGETIKGRDNKFDSWGRSTGYYKRGAVTPSRYQSDHTLNSIYDASSAKLNAKLCSKIRTIHISSGHEDSADDREFRATPSTYQDTYAHQKSVILSKIKDPDHFLPFFKKYSKKDRCGNDYVSIVKIPNIVSDCLGQDTPQYIIDKFSKLAFSKSIDRSIIWCDFRQLIPTAFEILRKDCLLYRPENSGLYVLMNKGNSLSDKDLGQAFGSLSSTYQSDFEPPSSEKCSRGPAKQVLDGGTNRGTKQLPGYMGHMPRNTRSEIKKYHSDGSIVHSIPTNNLMLTQGGFGSILGYEGYIPKAVSNQIEAKERTAGADFRTTTGAAYGPVRMML